jgi:hypothetical protein
MAGERRVDLQTAREKSHEVNLHGVRTNWRATLDLMQYGQSRTALHRPVVVLRYREPHLLGLNPDLYEARLAELKDRGESFAEPFVVAAGEGDRELDWDAVPEGVDRVVIPARAGQNNWSRISRKVAREGWHVIISRNDETAGVFVPADFLGPVDEAGEPV